MNIKVFFGAVMVSVIMVLIGVTLSNQSIRLDEAQSVWVTTKPIVSVLNITSRDVHTPLYFVLLHYWIKIFGNGVIEIRMLSFLFYILTLPFLYKLVRSLGSSKLALATIALFSISPFIMWYSFEARMYSMLVFFTVLSHTYFLKLVESGGRVGKTRYIFSAVAGIYTHYFFVFIILSQALYLLLKRFTKKHYFSGEDTLGSQDTGSILRAFIEAVTVIFIFFSPWIFFMVTQGAGQNTKPLIPSPDSYNILQTFVLFIFGYQSNLLQSLLVALWPLLGIFLFLIFTGGKKIDIRYAGYFVLVTFLPLLLLYLLSFIRPVFLPRYIIFITPTLFLLLAASLRGGDKNLYRNFTVFFLGLILIFLIMQASSNFNTAKEDYRGVTSYINEEVKASDIVVVSAPFTVYPVEYYYRGKARITTFPEWDRNEEGSIPLYTKKSIEDQVTKYRETYDRMFVLLSYDQGYENEVREYLDNNYQILGRKKYSPGLELSVYQLRYDEEQKLLRL